MEPTHSHDEIIALLQQNQALLQQNNELLHKQEQREQRRLLFKIVWYALLLGIPMIAYYYLYTTVSGLFGGSATLPSNAAEIGVSPAVLEELLQVYTGGGQ